MDEADLAVFARAWQEAPDGWTGRRYAEALVAADRQDDAARVHRAVWELGYPAGLFDLAWLEHGRGHVEGATALLTDALPELDDEDRALAHATIGHWLWDRDDAEAAEPHLRAGQDAWQTARADLAELLRTTGRRAESRAVLEAGAAADERESMLPLANLLDELGDATAAEDLYRRAWALGDPYSAWNLSLLLLRTGRVAEAEEWRWRAAQGGDEVAIRSLGDGLVP